MSNQEFAPQPFKLTENNENQSFINAESGRLTLAPQETRQAITAIEAPSLATAQSTVDGQFGGLNLYDSTSKAVSSDSPGQAIGGMSAGAEAGIQNFPDNKQMMNMNSMGDKDNGAGMPNMSDVSKGTPVQSMINGA